MTGAPLYRVDADHADTSRDVRNAVVLVRPVGSMWRAESEMSYSANYRTPDRAVRALYLAAGYRSVRMVRIEGNPHDPTVTISDGVADVARGVSLSEVIPDDDERRATAAMLQAHGSAMLGGGAAPLYLLTLAGE